MSKVMGMQQHYKKKPFGFGNTRESRLIRAEKQEKSRKEQRAKNFLKNRNITEVSTTPMQDAETINAPLAEDRMNKLLKWKADRDRRRKMELMRRKPVFKVGVVHHKMYSPLDKTGEVKPVGKICMQVAKATTPQKRITRATVKRLNAKKDAIKTEISNTIKSERDESQPKQKISSKKKTSVQEKQETSFAPVNHKFKAPENLSHVPMFGRIAIANTPKNKGIKTEVLDTSSNNSGSDTKECAEIKELRLEVENYSIHDTKDSSIEAVTLHLSSDEQDTVNTSHGSGRKSNNPNVSISSQKENVSTPVAALPATSQEPAFFSPYIVLSRGKSSARKEQKLRLGIGSQGSDDIPTKETVIKNLNISVEEEERTAQYFKFILNKEISRLTDLCDKWAELKSIPEITEDGQYLINQAIGQTNLLLRKKFQRFQGLVKDCETGKGEMLVTCKDLQGFWDAMYMEIRNCDSRFDKLEKLRANNWEEEEQIEVRHNVKKKTGPKRTKQKSIVAAKSGTRSSIRNLILAARKKKQQQSNMEDITEAGDLLKCHSTEQSTSSGRRSMSHKKSVSPKVHSKVTAGKEDGSRLSLLQKVQLSEASKKMRSPLTIMKVSQMCKTPEVELDETISYVNSNQTPGKSILKRLEKSVEDKCSNIKSSNKVNFDDRVVMNEVPIDEELQTKLNLSLALARIESFDFDNLNADIKINAERKLDFENDSFAEEDDSVFFPDTEIRNFGHGKNLNHIPATNVVVSPSPLTESNHISPVKHTDSDQINSSTTRVLRNRTVTNGNSTVSKKSMNDRIEDSGDFKENKNLNVERKKSLRKSSIRSGDDKKHEKSIDPNEVMETATTVTQERRKSARKSVTFDAKNCTGCTSFKPVHPVTPHTKRSMQPKLSLFGMVQNEQITPLPNGDLMLFDTPQKIPARVRRSSRKVH